MPSFSAGYGFGRKDRDRTSRQTAAERPPPAYTAGPLLCAQTGPGWLIRANANVIIKSGGPPGVGLTQPFQPSSRVSSGRHSVTCGTLRFAASTEVKSPSFYLPRR